MIAADGKTELPLIRTGLEVNNQAKQVALEAAKLAGRKVGRRESDVVRTPRNTASVDEVVSPVQEYAAAGRSSGHCKEQEKDDDWLPPDFDITTLPRFSKIFGWDKHNVELE